MNHNILHLTLEITLRLLWVWWFLVDSLLNTPVHMVHSQTISSPVGPVSPDLFCHLNKQVISFLLLLCSWYYIDFVSQPISIPVYYLYIVPFCSLPDAPSSVDSDDSSCCHCCIQPAIPDFTKDSKRDFANLNQAMYNLLNSLI